MAVPVEGSSSPTATAACGSVYQNLFLGGPIGAHAETQPSGYSDRYLCILAFSRTLWASQVSERGLFRFVVPRFFCLEGQFTTGIPDSDPTDGRSVLHVNT